MGFSAAAPRGTREASSRARAAKGVRMTSSSSLPGGRLAPVGAVSPYLLGALHLDGARVRVQAQGAEGGGQRERVLGAVEEVLAGAFLDAEGDSRRRFPGPRMGPYPAEDQGPVLEVV